MFNKWCMIFLISGIFSAGAAFCQETDQAIPDPIVSEQQTMSQPVNQAGSTGIFQKIYPAHSLGFDLLFSPTRSHFHTTSYALKTNHSQPDFNPFTSYDYQENATGQHIEGGITFYFQGNSYTGYWPVFHDELVLRPSYLSLSYFQSPERGKIKYNMEETFSGWWGSSDYMEASSGAFDDSISSLFFNARLTLNPKWDLGVGFEAASYKSHSYQTLTNSPQPVFTNRQQYGSFSGSLSLGFQPIRQMRLHVTGNWSRETGTSKNATYTAVTNMEYDPTPSHTIYQKYGVRIDGVIPVGFHLIRNFPNFVTCSAGYSYSLYSGSNPDNSTNSYSSTSHLLSATFGYCPADFLEIGSAIGYTISFGKSAVGKSTAASSSGTFYVEPFLKVAFFDHYRLTVSYYWNLRQSVNNSLPHNGQDNERKSHGQFSLVNLGLNIIF